jgi:hypothetical protein
MSHASKGIFDTSRTHHRANTWILTDPRVAMGYVDGHPLLSAIDYPETNVSAIIGYRCGSFARNEWHSLKPKDLCYCFYSIHINSPSYYSF